MVVLTEAINCTHKLINIEINYMHMIVLSMARAKKYRKSVMSYYSVPISNVY